MRGLLLRHIFYTSLAVKSFYTLIIHFARGGPFGKFKKKKIVVVVGRSRSRLGRSNIVVLVVCIYYHCHSCYLLGAYFVSSRRGNPRHSSLTALTNFVATSCIVLSEIS